ncbi:class I ribonucleotide reductase maintenance protein YfaE [Proteus mirabilis]|uniref:class I ribonucleotide reductase maintenance protein YfaE n=1 Tax=Proteus mirabilis TaxID=584 RepID=UPI0022E75F7C|nr:class I ribonucleotide reductase maintenance protein YfaE [Proteus mirabilis]
MASHKVTLHQQGLSTALEFSSETHPSLLDTLERSKIQIEYQCREGYCSSCRLRLVKGKVCYRNEPLAFIQADEILPCSCHPVSDIEIEICTK